MAAARVSRETQGGRCTLAQYCRAALWPSPAAYINGVCDWSRVMEDLGRQERHVRKLPHRSDGAAALALLGHDGGGADDALFSQHLHLQTHGAANNSNRRRSRRRTAAMGFVADETDRTFEPRAEWWGGPSKEARAPMRMCAIAVRTLSRCFCFARGCVAVR